MVKVSISRKKGYSDNLYNRAKLLTNKLREAINKGNSVHVAILLTKLDHLGFNVVKDDIEPVEYNENLSSEDVKNYITV